MVDDSLTLEWLPGRYAVCRLEPGAPIPGWADPTVPTSTSRLLCVTRTDDELTIVIDESLIPPGENIKAERGFVAMRIVGIVDFSLIGILSRLTGALAEAGVPVFVISTFDTDVLMVREPFRDRAVEALRGVAQINA
jgi:hypothetical protein